MDHSRWALGIITNPLNKAGVIPLRNLIEVLSNVSDLICIISGNNVKELNLDNGFILCDISTKPHENPINKILSFVSLQLEISVKIIIFRNKVNIWIFFLDSHTLLLPVITAKLLGNRIIFVLAASVKKSVLERKNFLARFLIYSESIGFSLSNLIILYSKNLVEDWGLVKYSDKIAISGEHFLDFDTFKMERTFNNRSNIIGYIGRLSEEKGILNFVRAIPELSNRRQDLTFLIGGEGHLRYQINAFLKENQLSKKVNLVGWIPHHNLASHLNCLKLIVLPSYTEGLPNVMLEAMACGTPVLATAVGVIPDIIEDGKTGFIMDVNSSECIAESVIRALEHPSIEQIANNAKSLIEREFTFDMTVKRWNKLIKDL